MGLALCSIYLVSSSCEDFARFFSQLFDTEVLSDDRGIYIVLNSLKFYFVTSDRPVKLPFELEFSYQLKVEQLLQKVEFYRYRYSTVKIEVIELKENSLSLLFSNSVLLRFYCGKKDDADLSSRGWSSTSSSSLGPTVFFGP